MTNPIHHRTPGIKLLIICALALSMTIPTLLVGNLVEDRANRAASVTNEISNHVGGPQTFLGPTLAIPFYVPAKSTAQLGWTGVYLVFPAEGSAHLTTATTERHRSLFSVPVYRAGLNFDATFNLHDVPAAAPPGAVFQWNGAEILVGASNTHSALADATMTMRKVTQILAPSQLLNTLPLSSDTNQTHKQLSLLSAKLPLRAKPDDSFQVSSALHFSGAEHIALLAYAQTTRVTAAGDWPDPGFDGATLPLTHTVTAAGFRAQWQVPFIARGVRAEGVSDSITGLNSTAVGLSFVEIADAYQSVNRALKYVLLIVGLVFLAYFLFETTTGKPVHPAQYFLVGLAQMIFYLLLLSVAERTGFDLGFLLAAAATVALLSMNVGWVFANKVQALKAFLAFSVLYVWIYLLLRLEDNALLIGAVSSFLAIAAAMYYTRNLNWYGTFSPARELGLDIAPPKAGEPV